MSFAARLEVYEKEATRTRRFLYVVGGAHLVLLTCAGAQIYLDGPFYLAQAIAVGMVISQVSPVKTQTQKFHCVYLYFH